MSSPVQATESLERKIREKKQEQEDNLAEISNLLRGDLLSENPQQAASSFGPHRVVPDRWKGMTQEQLEQIRLVQKQQVQEKLVPTPSPPHRARRRSPGPLAAFLQHLVIAAAVLVPRRSPQGVYVLGGVGGEESRMTPHMGDVLGWE